MAEKNDRKFQEGSLRENPFSKGFPSRSQLINKINPRKIRGSSIARRMSALKIKSNKTEWNRVNTPPGRKQNFPGLFCYVKEQICFSRN